MNIKYLACVLCVVLTASVSTAQFEPPPLQREVTVNLFDFTIQMQEFESGEFRFALIKQGQTLELNYTVHEYDCPVDKENRTVHAEGYLNHSAYKNGANVPFNLLWKNLKKVGKSSAQDVRVLEPRKQLATFSEFMRSTPFFETREDGTRGWDSFLEIAVLLEAMRELRSYVGWQVLTLLDEPTEVLKGDVFSVMEFPCELNLDIVPNACMTLRCDDGSSVTACTRPAQNTGEYCKKVGDKVVCGGSGSPGEAEGSCAGGTAKCGVISGTGTCSVTPKS